MNECLGKESFPISVYYRCSDGRCSFEIEHRADSSKVTDMHEATAGNMSDVIGEAKVLVKKLHLSFGHKRLETWSKCVNRCRV